MPEDFEKVSEYNQAGLQILRLHDAWNSCAAHRKNGSLMAYKWDLESIELEMYADVKRLDENRKEKDESLTFEHQLNELNFKILFYEIKKNIFKYYAALIEKEKLLRYITEKSGKGSKLRYSDEDDFD